MSFGNIKEGSLVEIKKGTTIYYPGSPSIPSWVISDYNHRVTQILSGGKPVIKGGIACVLLGKKVNKKTGVEEAGINTWINIESLSVIDIGGPKPSVSTSASQPAVNTSASQPSTSTSASQPAASTSASQPSVSTSVSQPTASTSGSLETKTDNKVNPKKIGFLSRLWQFLKGVFLKH